MTVDLYERTLVGFTDLHCVSNVDMLQELNFHCGEQCSYVSFFSPVSLFFLLVTIYHFLNLCQCLDHPLCFIIIIIIYLFIMQR